MKIQFLKITMLSAVIAFTAYNCSSDDDNLPTGPTGPNFTGTFVQEDQMGRPAINTVLVSSGSKDAFNTTIPSQQNAMFQAMFQANLEGLSPAYNTPTDANALGLTAAQFDGVNVLTGRALADDVISVELLLIFGGEDGNENPGLSSDNVVANDKDFSTSFPYLASPW